MIKAQAEANAIRTLQEVELPKLQARLADIKGIFKGNIKIRLLFSMRP